MSGDVELTAKFGSTDMSETIAKINNEANARIDIATTEKERIQIQAERKAALRDVEGIRDRLRGTYKLPDDRDGILLRSGRIARQVNFTHLLGGSFISAFLDLGKPVFNYGLTSVFKDGFLPTVRDLKSIRLAGMEAREAGRALDMVLDSRAMAMADIADDYGRSSKFERAVNTASSRFGVVSLLAPWTAAMKQFSSLVIINNFLRAASEVAAGTADAKTIGRLASASISPDLARRISAEFKTHGKTDGGSRWANTGAWTDREASEAFRAMLVREVDRTIVTVGQDKPLWMSTETGKLIGQFKSFGVASVQKTLFVGLQQRDAAVLNGTMVMLGLGLMSHLTYSMVSGREIDWDPRVLASNALDKSGILGWLMDANGLLEKWSSGRAGMAAVTGKQVTRFESRNGLSALAGPTIGLVQDAWDISTGLTDKEGEFDGKDIHAIRQLLPMQNLFYIRRLLDQVEEGFNDVVGLKQREARR